MPAHSSSYRPQAVLGCVTNFSFLHGASHPAEIVSQAARLGWQSVGISDINSCAGLVRAHLAAEADAITLLAGACLTLSDGPDVICYVRNRAGYESLCQLLSAVMCRPGRTSKDALVIHKGELARLSCDVELITVPPLHPDADYRAQCQQIDLITEATIYAGAYLMRDGCDEARLEMLSRWAVADGFKLVALGHVLYHLPDRRPLADLLSCIREKKVLQQAGYLLSRNAERHLLSPDEMARRWRGYEMALKQADMLAHRCQFSLSEISYEYPDEVTGAHRTALQELEYQTDRGANTRYPDGVPEIVKGYLKKELALVGRLNYAAYFLTVFDIVRFARSRNILCQGRGSAANSAICYCLYITSVDPARSEPLFERFVSDARNEPPDIDVDFEHQRREEIIQYIYHRYGRHRTGLAATVITYRSKSAFVETAKAFGLSRDVQRILSTQVWGRKKTEDATADARMLHAAGLDPHDRLLKMVMHLARQLRGFPRHLSQHVGGFVIARTRLDSLCVIRPAAMQARTIVEWDKDDLDALGLLKVDILALGMLTCLQSAFQLLARHYQRPLTLASLPPEDKATYDMLCRGLSIGVFQVESRAQMAMLPRLQPRSFHDLVVQVAIVRPGPIQGDMVHPYLRRRAGSEAVEYPSDELRTVLERTLGVPLFQEQAMKIAIVGAGFSPEDADRLRRAMATFRKNDEIHGFFDKMVNGMVARGYDPDFAVRCFRQIEGFGTYGFPESHAASFALLVYASAWLKCHYPDVFTVALLNAQPMGFYSPSQLVAEAKRSGVDIRPIDINQSDWDTILEPTTHSRYAIRLGLRLVKGLGEAEGRRIAACRNDGYHKVEDVLRRADVSARAVEALARGDGFGSLGLTARQALWHVRKHTRQTLHTLPLFASSEQPEDPRDTDSAAALPTAGLGETVAQDYQSTGLSLKAHPVDVLAPYFIAEGWQTCSDIARARNGRRLNILGLVTMRQRPGTANGTVFITLEDGQGCVNVIIWGTLVEQFRQAVIGAHLLGVKGRVQKQGQIIHFMAEALYHCDHYLKQLQTADRHALTLRSRDFH